MDLLVKFCEQWGLEPEIFAVRPFNKDHCSNMYVILTDHRNASYR